MKRFVGVGMLLLVAALVFLEAFHAPWGSSTGLDPSWQVALTEAHLRSLAFGKDIVFTYGPLGYLEMGTANADSYNSMLAFSIAAALLCAGLVIYCLTEPGPVAQKVTFVLAMLVAFSTRGSLLFLATIIAWTLPVFRRPSSASGAALALGIFSGIAALTKFNLALTAGVGGLLLFGIRAALAWRTDEAESEIASLLSFVVGFVVAYGFLFANLDYGWALTIGLAGSALCLAALRLCVHSVNDKLCASIALLLSLPLVLSPSCRSFTIRSIEIASGYSSAMSFQGSTLQLLLALFCGVLVTVLVVGNLRSITMPVAVALMVAAFVGFKEGFVRQPRHVVFVFLVFFLIAAAVTRLSVDRRRFMVGLTCVLLSVFALDIVNKHEGYPGPAASTFRPAAFEEHVSSLIGSLRSPTEVAEAFVSGLAADRLPDAVRSEIGARTVEALPWESAAVFANGFNWQPDPVFQAYSAYTPSLDELNATHLEKNGAAHVLYTWSDIDGRYLLWDQPAANRVLLCRYRVNERLSSPVFTQSGTPMLLLSRTSQRCGEPKVGTERRFSWNQEISVQGGAGLTFAKISIRYSILGRLMETLFRIPRVYVKVYGVDGTQVASYRIVEDTADDGVLVSPFPQSLLEFKNTLQGARDVKPIRKFVVKSDAAYLFDSDIKVRFASVRYR